MGQATEDKGLDALGRGVPVRVWPVALVAFQDDKELHEQCNDKTGGPPGCEAGEEAAEQAEGGDEYPTGCESCTRNACPVSCPFFKSMWGKTTH